MTLAATLAPPAAAARAQTRRASLSGWDALAVAGLAALWCGVLLVGCTALPMQLWDESRNANNALEMALHGHWLAPTYGGVVDHWNTKPPLMIWAMAALLKLGLPTLFALRLPAMAAALAAALMIFAALRAGLKDRFAAFAGAALLLASPLYVGVHGARTADYDAPESAFMLGYVLAVWAAFQTGRARWLLGAAAGMALGVLTKGIAALLPLPGLLLFALVRPARAIELLRAWPTWAAAALLVGLAGGYYAGRELYDPGYLAAIAHNELGGRFLQVTENHRGDWRYYLRVLAQQGGAGVFLAPLGLAALLGRDPRRRSLAAAAALSAGSLLLVLSAAKSKMEWYAAPLEPLLCLLAGAGVGELLRRAEAAGGGARAARTGLLLRCAFALILAWAVVSSVGWAQRLPARKAAEAGAAQYGYGDFLHEVHAAGVARSLTVVDGGFYNDAGFAAYDPMLKFYADQSTARGLPVAVRADDRDLDVGTLAASCDGRALGALGDDYRLQPVLERGGCRLVRILGDAP